MANPKILTRLVTQLEDKWFNKNAAFWIAVSKLQSSGNLKKWSTEPTKKWVIRWNMTPAERAIDRASTKSWKDKSLYKYIKKTNTAILK